ncbi:MAG: DUF3263 domain-containing protein [Actinomycetia bacterium]|nr:DUF3263 domain-containing protein [Actinomycetes bacterium]
MTVATAHSTQGQLSEQESQILAFERDWWLVGGAKEEAIREKFGLSATRYYQTLNTLIDQPAALEADPVLVRRLQRLRQSRQQTRSAGRIR